MSAPDTSATGRGSNQDFVIVDEAYTPGLTSPEDFRRSVRRLRRFDQRLGPHIDPIPLPELADLDLPDRVPGDAPARRPPSDCWHSALVWYRADGTPIGSVETFTAAEWAELNATRDPFQGVGLATLYRGGVRLTISTLFFALDHARDGGAPMLWNTVVFQAHRRRLDFGDPVQEWWYRSRAAALAGHRHVIAAIAAVNRARRAAWRAHPRTAPLSSRIVVDSSW